MFICLSKIAKINSNSETIYIQSLIVETFIQCCSSLGKRKFRTDSRLTHDVHLWQHRLWSFQGRDTKLESFLAKNQLQSNEITKFGELE